MTYRKLCMGLAPVLAIVAFAAAPGAAQATVPHWFSNSIELSKECPTPKIGEECSPISIGYGHLELKGEVGSVLHSVIQCQNVIAGISWNPEDGTAGKGEIDAFGTFNCEATTCGVEKTEVVAEKLPWGGQLLEEGTVEVPFRAETTKIKVGVFCNGTRALGFGSGTGKNAPLAPAGADKGTGAKSPGFETFDTGSGELEAEPPFTGKSKTLGKVHLLGYAGQELIQVK